MTFFSLQNFPLKVLWICIGMFFFMPVNAQVKSPEEFFKKYGQQFTPHHLLIDYAHHLADRSDRVKLFEYGESYEGRPLIYVVISTEHNIRQLEDIRKNHLVDLGISEGEVDEDLLRSILWLSHGVHGNEAAATESAILNMYALASGTSEIAGQLDSTLVIIDPCLNPDGFDRYVQFYRSASGLDPNEHPATYEHKEPWPGGRVNHYQFDLNRDWAWQTQVESQQRMKAYFNWLPHIHVDIHEQYPEDPYYFAPAAPPFHEEIEDWQIDLQKDIGKNNAKYFDKNAWVYFTGEIFDLYYPSYGDTYPILNGAIGMTYEQAGHGIAGLEYLLDNGDTLTLQDRIIHHHTSSMATVESTRKLYKQLLKLQREYFHKYSPTTFEGYIFKHDPDNQLSLKESFTELLDLNHIEYSYVSVESSQKAVSIWNFGNEQYQDYYLKTGDIFMPANQPAGRLLKVLSETSPLLKDTLTYDITSWSIALAYGDLFGMEEGLSDVVLSKDPLPERVSDLTRTDSNYAAILRFDEEKDYHALSDLFKMGINMRVATKPFTFESLSPFPEGTIVIMKADNSKRFDELHAWNRQMNLGMEFTGTAWTEEGPDLGSDAFRLLKSPRIALMRDDALDVNAFGFAWYFLDQQMDYPYDVLHKKDLIEKLDSYNTILLTDGNIEFSDSDYKQLKDWVKQGGKLISIGKSAAYMCNKEDFDTKIKVQNMDSILVDPNSEYAFHNPGAVVRTHWVNEQPLGYHMDDVYYSLKTSELAFEHQENTVVGGIQSDVKIYGFMGKNIQQNLKNSALFLVEPVGSGKAIFMADDPLFRGFWKRGYQIMWNALFFVN